MCVFVYVFALVFSAGFKLATVLFNWHFNEKFVIIIVIIMILCVLVYYFCLYFYAVPIIGQRSIDLHVNNQCIIIIIIIIIIGYHLFCRVFSNYVPEKNHDFGYKILQLFCIYNLTTFDISHAESSILLHEQFRQYVCIALCACLFSVFSWRRFTLYVARVFSERFWDGYGYG
jgi:hypothetical protein